MIEIIIIVIVATRTCYLQIEFLNGPFITHSVVVYYKSLLYLNFARYEMDNE